MEQRKNRPPAWVITLLEFIVHPDFIEEIEGDLLEKYSFDLHKHGYKTARLNFFAGMLSVIRPRFIFSPEHRYMRISSQLLLVIMTMGIFTASIAPFLPGPTNHISHEFSRFAQFIGYAGLLFVPFGLLWLVIEIRSKKGVVLNRWTNGYYPALLVLTPVFVFVPIQVIRAFSYGNNSIDLWPLVIIFLIIGFIMFRIQKLRKKTERKFNSIPVFIVMLPLVAMLSSKFAVEKFAGLVREEAIVKTEHLLGALERYRLDNAGYPEKLDDLVGKYIAEVPKIKRMGISAYRYQKTGETYQLSFEQYYHWYATEVVVYQRNGHDIVKANYENYPTNNPDWRYYLAD